MKTFVEKHKSKITATLECFDRIIFKGHLPFSYPHAMQRFMDYHGILIKDFKPFVLKQAQSLKSHAKNMAARNNRPFIYLNGRSRKEEWAKKIVQRDRHSQRRSASSPSTRANKHDSFWLFLLFQMGQFSKQACNGVAISFWEISIGGWFHIDNSVNREGSALADDTTMHLHNQIFPVDSRDRLNGRSWVVLLADRFRCREDFDEMLSGQKRLSDSVRARTWSERSFLSIGPRRDATDTFFREEMCSLRCGCADNLSNHADSFRSRTTEKFMEQTQLMEDVIAPNIKDAGRIWKLIREV